MHAFSLRILPVLIVWTCHGSVAASPLPQLPAEQPINKAAGRGGPLTVKVRLESGEEIGFIVDTGSPGTVFDKSLERKLGRRWGTVPISKIGGHEQKAGIFAAPRIYLGSVELTTGPHVYSYDFKRKPMGILGMDCLRHYCVQLDFEAGKIRFLRPDEVSAGELGQAITLELKTVGATNEMLVRPEIAHGGFLGNGATRLAIDSGCGPDGLVQKGTNKFGGLFLPEYVWEGTPYTNLIVGAPGQVNALGLRFLARHIVTLDFPRQTLYLKRTRCGALDEDGAKTPGESARSSAMRFLLGLRQNGELHGVPPGGKAPIFFDHLFNSGSNSEVFWFRVDGDSATYHYKVVRASKDGLWRLQKLWRTNGGVPTPRS